MPVFKHLSRFRVVRPPSDLSRQVAAKSVVVPLAGASRDRDDLVRKALLVTDWWRRRIRRLKSSPRGWDLTREHESNRTESGTTRSRKWRMINCRPAAFTPDVRTYTCNVPAICPH